MKPNAPLDSNFMGVARNFRSWSAEPLFGHLMTTLEIDSVGGWIADVIRAHVFVF